MALLCLSCTVYFHGPYRALNLYSCISGWCWSFGCFPLVSDFILAFRFYLSSWKDVLLPVDLSFIPLCLIYCRCHHFYATVKRPAVFPFVHTLMYLTYFGVICPMCVIPTIGEPRLKNNLKYYQPSGTIFPAPFWILFCATTTTTAKILQKQ